MGGFPIALGGEHSITYGVVKGLLDAGIKDIGVIQIDAHANLRDTYLGDKYSHASVMKRVVIYPIKKLPFYGIRPLILLKFLDIEFVRN